MKEVNTEPKGVTRPLPCPAETIVRVTSEQPTDPGILCRVGEIEAGGTLPIPNGDDQLLKVCAYVYREKPESCPDPPEDDPNFVCATVDPLDREFSFDAIPNVHCENNGTASDNYLVIWAEWVSADGQTTTSSTRSPMQHNTGRA